MRLAYCDKNRARTSGGKLGLLRTSECRIALLETLLTFCPPGPLLRAKESRSSASVIFNVGVIPRSMKAAPTGDRRGQACILYWIAIDVPIPRLVLTLHDYSRRGAKT